MSTVTVGYHPITLPIPRSRLEPDGTGNFGWGVARCAVAEWINPAVVASIFLGAVWVLARVSMEA